MTSHTHHLSNGQLICDNEQCREKARDQIKELNNEIKTEFDATVQTNSKDNKIKHTQGWNIMCLVSKNLSDKLVLIFDNEEIRQIIKQFIEQNNTKQAFTKAFDYEKQQNLGEFITKEQLWNIYLKMCNDAVRLLSKAKNERKTHVANFLVFDENEL